MPRFVVLEHDSPRGLHWDFMLEYGASLATWALASPPDTAPEMAAEALPDHRAAYLDYEGPVSGDRGSVRRWDGGAFQLRSRTGNRWAVFLTGTRLRGEAVLERLPTAPSAWRFTYRAALAGETPSL